MKIQSLHLKGVITNMQHTLKPEEDPSSQKNKPNYIRRMYRKPLKVVPEKLNGSFETRLVL